MKVEPNWVRVFGGDVIEHMGHIAKNSKQVSYQDVCDMMYGVSGVLESLNTENPETMAAFCEFRDSLTSAVEKMYAELEKESN